MPYPVMFQVNNTTFKKTGHCGVLEFTSPDDVAYMPIWMMENLLASDGLTLDFQLTINLPKLNFVKFQPQEFAFTKILDPRQT